MSFDAMVSEARLELARRATAKERILLRLRRGPATTSELVRIATRFGARIKELREDGYGIKTDPKSPGEYVYSL